MNSLIRLLSIDDHWEINRGLSSLRGDREEIVLGCGCKSIDDALKIDPEKVDVIILDLMIPGTEPEQNLSQIKRRFYGKPVIIQTSQENGAWELRMYERGASGFITKDKDRKDLLRMIRNVYEGRDYAKERIALLKSCGTEELEKLKLSLSPFEREILEKVYKEEAIQTIAEDFDKSESKIYATISGIKKRFNIKSDIAFLKFLMRIFSPK